MKKLPSISLDSLRVPAGMQRVVDGLKNGSQKVSLLGAAGGAGIDVVSATRDERAYMSDIADEYRPEIAERLGLAENQVTQQHYQMAFSENPVLAQAQDVAKMSGVMRAANSAIAVGVGTLAGLAASSFSRPKMQPDLDMEAHKGKDPSNIAGGVAATFSAAAAGKVARKMLHTNHLDKKMEKTAHHKIMEIKEKQQRGEETTAVDIFTVQLALNPEVDKSIEAATGKRFADMEAEQQQEILQTEFPEVLQANAQMADLINRDGMRPQQLVFGEIREKEQEPVAPGHPDLPPNAALPVEPVAVEASHAQEAARELQQQEPVAPPPAPHVTPRSERPLEQPGEASHVERFAPQAAQEQTSGFTDRVETAREQQPDAALQR